MSMVNLKLYCFCVALSLVCLMLGKLAQSTTWEFYLEYRMDHSNKALVSKVGHTELVQMVLGIQQEARSQSGDL